MDKPAVNGTGNGHAKYAPSGSHRWLVCHGSVALSEGIADRRSSYAEEGTECHEAAALVLQDTPWDQATADLSDDQLEIVEEYTNYIFETMDRLADQKLLPKLWIEQRVVSTSSDNWAGTADCGILAGRTLGIFDLKAGYVPVAVKDEHFGFNPQLGSYAVLFLDTHGLWDRVDKVRLTIIQPRVYDKPQQISVPVADLWKFKKEVLGHIKEIEGGDPTLKAGDHCQFCPAKGKCPELRAKAVEKAKLVFGCPAAPKDYTNEQIAEILAEAEMIEAHLAGVRQYAMRELEKGRQIPGWKLVPKRAAYKWTDPNEAMATARAAGVPREELVTEKMKTPLQFYKAFKDAGVTVNIDNYFVKESSGPTLAKEEDKRDAIKIDPFGDKDGARTSLA